MAYGLIMSRNAYLREFLNVLDFTIVASGLTEFYFEVFPANDGSDQSQSAGILKILRILRIIRPLRSIRALPTMRKLVKALMNSLPQLMNVLIFLFFVILLFGILGLQEFNSTIYNRCRTTPAPINATYWPKSEEHTSICSKEGYESQMCPEGLTCGNPLEYGILLEHEGVDEDASIQYNVVSFENIFSSLLSVFQIITMDSWTLIMYNLIDGSGELAFMPVFFCVTLIIFGSYFLLNLVLAVIMQAFVRLQEQEFKQLLEEHERLRKLYDFHKRAFASSKQHRPLPRKRFSAPTDNRQGGDNPLVRLDSADIRSKEKRRFTMESPSLSSDKLTLLK